MEAADEGSGDQARQRYVQHLERERSLVAAARWLATERLEHEQFHPPIQRAPPHSLQPPKRYHTPPPPTHPAPPRPPPKPRGGPPPAPPAASRRASIFGNAPAARPGTATRPAASKSFETGGGNRKDRVRGRPAP